MLPLISLSPALNTNLAYVLCSAGLPTLGQMKECAGDTHTLLCDSSSHWVFFFLKKRALTTAEGV